MNKLNDSLPIIDPTTKKVLGNKQRSLVHQDGDWHYGIQAYIIRNNAGTVEVLVQKRSPHVDISKLRFDQSLAVQMLEADNLNFENALQRGLFSEFQLNLQKHRFVQIFSNIDLQIIKTYKQHQNILNRELLKLFFIEYSDQLIVPNSKYIDEILWIPIDKLFDWQKTSPDLFTKTSRFYAVDPIISETIKNSTHNFLSKKDLKELTNIQEISYYSEAQSEHDISVHKNTDGKENYYIFDVNNNFTLMPDIQHPSSFHVQ